MNALVNNTAFNYAVTMVATLVASRLGWDNVETANLLNLIVAAIVQLVGVWTAYRGVAESKRDKVVIDGKRVLRDDLSATIQGELTKAVRTAPKRRKTLLDIIQGK